MDNEQSIFSYSYRLTDEGRKKAEEITIQILVYIEHLQMTIPSLLESIINHT
jgi:hypothetical protein